MPSTHKTSDQILSKQGQPIEVGDHVFTKIRGGSHEGNVRFSSPDLSFFLGNHKRSAGLYELRREMLLTRDLQQVEKIVRTEEEAEAEGVKHPPKVRISLSPLSIKCICL